MRRTALLLAIALLASLTVAAPAAATTMATTTASGAHARTGVHNSAYEHHVVKQTNRRRAHHDRTKVRPRACVDRFAERWARHMANKRRLVHQSLGPIMRRCHLRLVGENIAVGFRSPNRLVRAWMHSRGHRANILRKGFRQIGVGAARDKHGRYWVSQVFGRHR